MKELDLYGFSLTALMYVTIHIRGMEIMLSHNAFFSKHFSFMQTLVKLKKEKTENIRSALGKEIKASCLNTFQHDHRNVNSR